MRNFVRGLAALATAGAFILLTLSLAVQAALPKDFRLPDSGELSISPFLYISAQNEGGKNGTAVYGADGGEYSLNLRLSGKAVPASQNQSGVPARRTVVPGGMAFGIKMFTDGIMVVGMTDIQQNTGSVNPAKEAGIKVGDILLSIDGNKLSRNDDVAHYIAESGGGQVKIVFSRSGNVTETYLTPVKTDYDGVYKAGIWVRDSSAGIGTLTYYDPSTMGFAGLGHAICDVDTGKIMPLSSGEIVSVNISGASTGLSGRPGELRGSFSDGEPMGRLTYNSEKGIFGRLEHSPGYAEPVQMAHRQDIVTGPATMLSTISGSHPQEFDVVIERVNHSDTVSTKNMIIRIVDQSLLNATGGIVQGMSGSPILQNNMLAGAVTHVFVNDPTRGYAIFAENMDNQLSNVDLYPNAA
ncbi:MAG: SpoIVB peptidase [Oscillospiraceae bacterium]|nr:SpoIVB peptidase [Oscillospiraceae bacterium]